MALVTIRRAEPPAGEPGYPFKTAKGYKMADPAHGEFMHHAEHAIYIRTIEVVVDGIKAGRSFWIKQPGKRETLITAAKLKVTVT